MYVVEGATVIDPSYTYCNAKLTPVVVKRAAVVVLSGDKLVTDVAPLIELFQTALVKSCEYFNKFLLLTSTSPFNFICAVVAPVRLILILLLTTLTLESVLPLKNKLVACN